MSFDDPFEDFKRKKAEKPKPAPGRTPSQERLEKVSDYFPAFKPGAPAPAPPAPEAAPPVRSGSASPQMVALCNALRAKGILTLDEVRRILDPVP